MCGVTRMKSGFASTSLMKIPFSALSLALAIVGTLVVAEAQPAGKIYRVGVLSPEAHPPGLFETFIERLRELGYVEGKNIAIESRDAGGRHERLAVLAKELVRLRVDVIVAVNTPAAQAAKNATTTIPIVMSRISDPVKTGLIPSFSRPGGNITGLSFQPEETSLKRLQLLKEALPSVTRVAALWYEDNPGPGMTIRAIEPASAQLGLQLLKLPVRDPNDFPEVLQAAARGRADALFVVDDVFVTRHGTQIFEFAAKHSLPVIAQYKEFVELGALMAYGPSTRDMYRRTADYVDRILKGARPTDLPVEQPTKYDLVINLKTAKALGVTISQSVLTRADELIR
jgi:putative ABC transport system substrate-binding protein